MGMAFKSLAQAAIGSALMAALPGMTQVRDVEMKAAYIYNFAQFVTWPAARAREPLVVCADRASVLWHALHVYNGREIGLRKWQLQEAAAGPQGPGCDVLVLGRTAAAQAGAGVLVIRDGTGAAPAAITLIDDDAQLRFDIDTRAIASSGLRVSSKLLNLARNVL